MAESTNIPLFLFGNGLSIALSSDFSLKIITRRFIESLSGTEKEFLSELCGGAKNLNFDDFEENFARLEEAYKSLSKYNHFIKSTVGQKFLTRFELPDPNLQQHEEIIRSIYHQYIFQILSVIRDKVTKKGIEENLSGFTKFLKTILLRSKKGFVFTLNYDLLAETIMLEDIGTENFTDFCSATGSYKLANIPKFDFDPALSRHVYGEKHSTDVVELHHLHGSLSLFNDSERNKAIKFKNEDIFLADVYNSIVRENWSLYPAIITGGGKSLKMNEYPFEFYYRRLKDLCTYGKFNKLFIIGYSFRDDHINDLIQRWIKAMDNYTNGMLIIDYKSTDKDREEFKSFVRGKIKLKPSLPDSVFLFDGANAIHDVSGSLSKVK